MGGLGQREVASGWMSPVKWIPAATVHGSMLTAADEMEDARALGFAQEARVSRWRVRFAAIEWREDVETTSLAVAHSVTLSILLQLAM